MSFLPYQRVGSNVIACELNVDHQQAVLDLLTSPAVASQLNDFKTTTNSETNGMEFDFRYKSQANIISLRTGDWVVQHPDGAISVMTTEQFIMNYVNAGVDYIVPSDKNVTFEQAVLKYINANFPDLRDPEIGAGEAVQTYRPVTITNSAVIATTASGGDSSQVVATVGGINQENLSISVNVTDPATYASVLVGTGVKVGFTSSVVSTYFITIGGSNTNPPVAWTVTTENAAGEVVEVDRVVRSDNKTGAYKIDNPVALTNLTVTFDEWEDSLATTGDVIVTMYTGGAEVTTEAPTYEELTDDLLNDVKDRFVTWYDEFADTITISLPSSVITSFKGLVRVVNTLLKASFVKPTTKFYFDFKNIAPVDVQTPNVFGIDALECLAFEIRGVIAANRERIIGFDFSAIDETAISAIAASVTSNTEYLWEEFVNNLINTTGIKSFNEVKK